MIALFEQGFIRNFQDGPGEGSLRHVPASHRDEVADDLFQMGRGFMQKFLKNR